MQIEIKKENGASVAFLSGEIDHHCAKDLRTQLDRHIIGSRPSKLIIDLNNITFMDSSGIGLIMGRSKLMKACGGEVVVNSPQPYIKRVLKLAGIDRIVSIT